MVLFQSWMLMCSQNQYSYPSNEYNYTYRHSSLCTYWQNLFWTLAKSLWTSLFCWELFRTAPSAPVVCHQPSEGGAGSSAILLSLLRQVKANVVETLNQSVKATSQAQSPQKTLLRPFNHDVLSQWRRSEAGGRCQMKLPLAPSKALVSLKQA